MVILEVSVKKMVECVCLTGLGVPQSTMLHACSLSAPPLFLKFENKRKYCSKQQVRPQMINQLVDQLKMYARFIKC